MDTVQPQPHDQGVEYAGVRFEARHLVLLEHGGVSLKIPRDEITSIRPAQGFQSLHPLAQTVTGALLCGVCILPLRHLIRWFRHGGTLFALEVWLLVFLPIGLVMIFTAARRGDYLEVQTRTGRKKLPLARTDPSQLQSFLRSVATLGYPITS